jgi:DNA-binding MarR family transcriptional regulator
MLWMARARQPSDRDPSGAGSAATRTPSTGVELDCPEDDYDGHARWAATTWPEVDEVVETIVNRIDMAQRHLERAAVDTRDAVGLAQGELKVLLRLTRGPRSHGDLAKSLLVSSGTMTNQLDKLEGAGLVVRHPDPNDRRGKVLEITAKGQDVLDNYVNVQAKREREFLEGLTVQEKAALNALLRKLLASLRERSGAPGAAH